jgi:Holliday junction resolvasome RuvABC ATP-dependent DNA helicase subunit
MYMNEEFDIRRESLKTDQDFERALKPVRFEDFARQDKIIENLCVFVSAADCNQDGSVNIADVTTLIDYLLNGSWN